MELDSRSFDRHVSFNIQHGTLVKQDDWSDYARGAKYALRKGFVLNKGIKGTLQGRLPVGGPSLSAAVLIAYVFGRLDKYPVFRTLFVLGIFYHAKNILVYNTEIHRLDTVLPKKKYQVNVWHSL